MPDQPLFYEIPVVSVRLVRDAGFLADRSAIRSPMDIANLLMGRIGDLDREVMVVVHLDTRNGILSVLSLENTAIGSGNANRINIADLFRGAILANATAIILGHNHPSQTATPSPEDVDVTRKAVEAGELLGIEVMDHVIVTATSFVSLKERGLGFS